MAHIDVVRSRLQDLCERRKSVADEIAELRAHIGHLESEAHDISVQMSLLEDLFDEMVTADEDEETPRPEPRPDLPGPSDAVRQLLGEHPNGLSKGDVVRMLVGRIDTTSRDERRVLYNTIINLKHRGDVEEDEMSVLRLTTQESGTPF